MQRPEQLYPNRKAKQIISLRRIAAGSIVSLLFLAIGTVVAADSAPSTLPYPRIWITPAERSGVLEKIARYNWAADVNKELHARVDPAVTQHLANPGAVLGRIPAFGNDDSKEFGEHSATLALAADAAILHYLTGQDDYAQFAADIVNVYTSELSKRTPQTTAISRADERGTYPQLALTYDFIHAFLTKPASSVYDRGTRQRVPFDNAAAQRAFRNIASNALADFGPPDEHGRNVSNIPILKCLGALYPILCIEDDAERERLFDVFWNQGTQTQPSFKNSILPGYYRHKQGIWPESTSYGIMGNTFLVLNIIDRLKPELNVITDNRLILEGAFIQPQILHPDGRYIRYGDAKREKSGIGNLPMVRIMAHRKGLTEVAQRAESVMKKFYESQGGYRPAFEHSSFEYGGPPAFFWDVPFADSIPARMDSNRTVLINHAGIALVRNLGESSDPLHGLSGYIGGGHHVHSHCTGINLELYGAGEVMVPSAGMPGAVSDRAQPVHVSYRRLHAGNNTVIVNGVSHGIQQGAWKSGSCVYQDTAVNLAAEPGHFEEAISPNFGFATQFLDDTVNQCRQQRTLGVIRTSPTTGYYLDLFRSRSLGENRFHDYVLHQIGDETRLTDASLTPLDLAPTDKYDNDIGDLVKSPGWRFFENERSTRPTAEAVRVTVKINHDSRCLHLFVPGGVSREYTAALGPPTPEARNGYDRKKTQILAIRQSGEAWDRPYVAVLEPSLNGQPAVSSVEQTFQEGKLVAVEVVSLVDGATIRDIIIAPDKPDAVVSLAGRDIEFEGWFGIVRMERRGNSEAISLYIGDGRRLRCGQRRIQADDKRRGYQVTVGAKA